MQSIEDLTREPGASAAPTEELSLTNNGAPTTTDEPTLASATTPSRSPNPELVQRINVCSLEIVKQSWILSCTH